jgi:hypothetical protein
MVFVKCPLAENSVLLHNNLLSVDEKGKGGHLQTPIKPAGRGNM